MAIEEMLKRKTVAYSLKAPEKLAIRFEDKQKRNQYRTVFMRDRDRVLYSNPFRLLAGKTQVYISGIDDNMRTRLTHTLEVAQIAKTITSSLKLDPDLAEAIALGHDIGHTPYGHAGERVLHEIMTPHNKHVIKGCPLDVPEEADLKQVVEEYSNELGFKHNLHSVEVAISEAQKSEGQMLLLTNFTLYGMKTHSKLFYKDDESLAIQKVGYYKQFDKYCKLSEHDSWSFEAYVVQEADEIAQRHHDLEDAIRGNLISREVVCRSIDNHFKEFLAPSDRKMLKKMKKSTDNDHMFFAELSRLIVNLLVVRLIKCSIYNINKLIVDTGATEKKFPDLMIKGIEPSIHTVIISYDKMDDTQLLFSKSLESFQHFIADQVHTAYDIQKADYKGIYIIKKMFQAYYTNPQQLPDHCVIDYLVSTTHRTYYDVLNDKKNKGIGKLRKDFVDDMDKAKKENDIGKLLKLMRTICNYIASMTDREAQDMYIELY